MRTNQKNAEILALLEIIKEGEADVVFKKEDPKLYAAAKKAGKGNKNVISKDGPGTGEEDSVVVKKGTTASDLDEAEKKKNPAYHKGLSKSTQDKRQAQFNKQTKMSDSNPRAYKPAPGDSKETKPSKWNEKFKQMYGEVDAEGKLVEEALMEREITDLFEMLELTGEEDLVEALSKKIKSSLKKKAKKANAPQGALTTVYNKGLAAWKTGHRPGASQHAWAMARVNSFLSGGPARKVDSAQWDRVKKHRKKKRKK